MTLTLLLLSVTHPISGASPVATSWFGPVKVSASIPTTGNPFSPKENDVRVTFTQGGKKVERLAFFADGKWHAVLATNRGGTYQARFTRNGKAIGNPIPVTLGPAKDSEFVRLSGNRFRLESGKPFIPYGHNFGWQNGKDKSYPEQLADMAKSGLNWTRVWSNSWDSKNPFYPQEDSIKLEIGRMHEPALNRWDMIVQNCEKHNLKFQFVLFHHGLYSSTTDSNWKTNPWNRASGGFLAKPNDFFTDPRAKELSKAWLRYAVARWGHSPSVMAWELFNEVQWVDKVKEKSGWQVVADWHTEMARYLRSIDPYRHLVTTSSEVDPKVYAAMDYEQPHTYPPSVFGAISGTPSPEDKPLFFGEFGAAGAREVEDEAMVVRDGFWGGLLGAHAGPGAYWFWDRTYRRNLYKEFANGAKILRRSGYAEHPNVAPAKLVVEGAETTDLIVRPGRGWATTEQFVYNLPEDGSTGSFPKLSGYIQGAKSGNRSFMKEPIRLRFVARKPGTARFSISEISSQGADFTVTVNGVARAAKAFPATTRNAKVNEEIVVPFEAGRNEVVFDNPGNDWVLLDGIKIEGVGTGVSGAAIQSRSYGLARLTWSPRFGSTRKSVLIGGLADGSYEIRQFDLETGRERTGRVNVRGSKISPYVPFAKDEAFALFKR